MPLIYFNFFFFALAAMAISALSECGVDISKSSGRRMPRILKENEGKRLVINEQTNYRGESSWRQGTVALMSTEYFSSDQEHSLSDSLSLSISFYLSLSLSLSTHSLSLPLFLSITFTLSLTLYTFSVSLSHIFSLLSSPLPRRTHTLTHLTPSSFLHLIYQQ